MTSELPIIIERKFAKKWDRAVISAFSIIRPVPEDLPFFSLENNANSNKFASLFDSSLFWYLPSFALLDDPDVNFRFHVNVTKAPVLGTESIFKTGNITLGLKKIRPKNIEQDMLTNLVFEYREIPIYNVHATLNLITKDDTGTDQPLRIPLSITTIGNPENNEWLLSADADYIRAANVLALYQNLVNDIGATIVIDYTFDTWSEIDQSQLVFTTEFDPHKHDNDFPDFTGTLDRDKLASEHIDFDTFNPVLNRTETAHLNLDQSQEPGVYVYRSALATNSGVLLLGKFTNRTNHYQDKFTISEEGGITKVIKDKSDILNFDEKSSEFIKLTVIDRIEEKYPSISRLYLGTASRSIVVIPSQYVIQREKKSCAAVCNALEDTATTNKYQFVFTLVPDVSGIDLIKLWQEKNEHEMLKNCSLKFPTLLDSNNSTLLSDFRTSAGYSIGDEHSVVLSIEIKEPNPGSSTVNSIILTDQLARTQKPYLSGTIDIKLDDIFSERIEVPVTLSFKETDGSSAIEFNIDAQDNYILKNVSHFDINIERVALITSGNLTVRKIDQILLANQELSLPLSLSENPADLKMIIDFELFIGETLPRRDLKKYLQLQKINAQSIRHVLGVLGDNIPFESRRIKSIAIQVTLRENPNMMIPELKLFPERKEDSIAIIVPIEHLISSLDAIVRFNVKLDDDSEVKFTLENDFWHNPIFVINNSDIPTT